MDIGELSRTGDRSTSQISVLSAMISLLIQHSFEFIFEVIPKMPKTSSKAPQDHQQGPSCQKGTSQIPSLCSPNNKKIIRQKEKT